MAGVSGQTARTRHGRCVEAGGREGSRLRGGLQKLAKPLCPACEGAVLRPLPGPFAAWQVVKGQHREVFRFGRAIAGVAGLRSHLLAAELIRQVFQQLLEAFGICVRPLVRAASIEELPLVAVEHWRIVGAKPIAGAKARRNAMSLSTCALPDVARGWPPGVSLSTRLFRNCLNGALRG